MQPRVSGCRTGFGSPACAEVNSARDMCEPCLQWAAHSRAFPYAGDGVGCHTVCAQMRKVDPGAHIDCMDKVLSGSPPIIPSAFRRGQTNSVSSAWRSCSGLPRRCVQDTELALKMSVAVLPGPWGLPSRLQHSTAATAVYYGTVAGRPGFAVKSLLANISGERRSGHTMLYFN